MNERAILLTRPVERAQATLERLRKMGAEVVALPLVELRDLDTDPREYLEPAPDCVAFSSPSAVESFARRCVGLDGWQRWPAWAVGAATAEAMRAAGFLSIREAPRADGAALAEEMVRALGAAASVLLPGSRIRRPELPEALRAAGHDVREWDLYATVPRATIPAELLDRIDAGWHPLVLLYSPSAVDAWAALVKLHGLGGLSLPLALFGPTTARHAREIGLEAKIAMDEADEDRFLQVIGERWSRP